MARSIPMNRSRSFGLTLILALAALTTLPLSGCASNGEAGALLGAGLGALAGNAIGGDSGATVLGTAVGTGIGYMIGNEADKREARDRDRWYDHGRTARASTTDTRSATGRLGGTRWTVIELDPDHIVRPFVSKVIEFRPDGVVVTTTTAPDGRVDVNEERFRVIGQTLVVDKPRGLVNARFRITGDEMILNGETYRTVMRRL